LQSTAIHELAHHIHYTELNDKGKPHGKTFYTILNALLTIAIQKGMFRDERIEHLLKRQTPFRNLKKALEALNREETV
ncbi:MAG: hypothetical protein ACRCZB_06210, partial [Bacteroidales bacterium]